MGAELIRSGLCWLYNVWSWLCSTTVLRIPFPVYLHLEWVKQVLECDLGWEAGGNKATTILNLAYIVVGLIPQLMSIQWLHFPLHLPSLFSNSCVQLHGERPHILQCPHTTMVRGNKKWHVLQFNFLAPQLVLVGSTLFFFYPTLYLCFLPNCLPYGLSTII